jgi:hypothetical protein
MDNTDWALSPNDPIWTIEHISCVLHVAVDTAREYTYRDDFPASRDLGARNLWPRDEVLAWFMQLPPRQRREATPAPMAAPARRAYRPRGAKGAAA